MAEGIAADRLKGRWWKTLARAFKLVPSTAISKVTPNSSLRNLPMHRHPLAAIRFLDAVTAFPQFLQISVGVEK